MLVFSLDEQGDFEYLDIGNEPILIGGILFDDKCLEGEIAIEEQRIEAYYRAVCKEYSTEDSLLVYPESLHSNGNEDQKVGRLKYGVSKTIKEFLESGTFKGSALQAEAGNQLPKRRGVYYPYIFMKSEHDKEQFNDKSYNFMYEKYASNLYYHMVKDVINRVICQFSRKNDDKKYILHIATRSTPPFPTTDVRRVRYEEMGHEIITSTNLKKPLLIKTAEGKDVRAFRVQLTNKDVYRTVIREILSQHEMYDTHIQMDVKSISYHKDNNTNVFLYMADSICSLVSYKLKGNSADERFKEILERVKSVVNPSRFFVFGYDPVDDCYSKAYNAMLNGDIYEAYYHMYEGSLKTGAIAEHYQKYWFKKLEKEIELKIYLKDIEQAILKIEYSQKSNSYQINSSKFILDHIIFLCERKSQRDIKNISGNIMFRLYSAAVSAYSHLGAPQNAKESYSKALRYSYYASAEDFLRLKNKMVVILCDIFEFGEAQKLAKQNFILQKKIAEFKNDIIEILPPEGYLERNKTLSQIGQVYAFMRKKEAENVFKEALINMKKKTPNYYITMSYLLHFYLDNGMKEEYEKKAYEYFGGYSVLEEQFDYIVSQGFLTEKIISVPFALYVYTKALWFFYRDEISESLVQKLTAIDKHIRNGSKGYSFKSHPNEMILKYLMLIMIYKKEDKAYRRYDQFYDDSVKGQGDLVQYIGMYGRIQIKMALGAESTEMDIRILASKMFRTIESLESRYFPETKEELWNLLGDLFVYMYV